MERPTEVRLTPLSVTVPVPIDVNDWIEDISVKHGSSPQEIIGDILSKSLAENWMPAWPLTPPSSTFPTHIKLRGEVASWLEKVGAKYRFSLPETIVGVLSKARLESRSHAVSQ